MASVPLKRLKRVLSHKEAAQMPSGIQNQMTSCVHFQDHLFDCLGASPYPLQMKECHGMIDEVNLAVVTLGNSLARLVDIFSCDHL